MCFNIFKHNSYCVGGKHYSPTTNIYGDITNKNVKMLRGTCMMCSRNKSLIVSDRTIQGEGLGDFFKHLGKAAGSAAKNDGKKILNNPGRALEIAGNIGTAAATKNPKLIAATAPSLLNLFIKGRGYTKLKVCRVKVCRVKVCRVKVCRVKVCRVKVCRVKVCRVKVCRVKVCRVKVCRVKVCRVKVCRVKACILGKSTSYIH